MATATPLEGIESREPIAGEVITGTGKVTLENMDYRKEIAGIEDVEGERIAVGSRGDYESETVDSSLDEREGLDVLSLKHKEDNARGDQNPSEAGILEKPGFANTDRSDGGFLEQETLLSKEVREQSDENQSGAEINETEENERGTFPELSKATSRIESIPPIPEVHHPGNETGEPSVKEPYPHIDTNVSEVEAGKITEIPVPEILPGKEIETDDVNEDAPVEVVEPTITTETSIERETGIREKDAATDATKDEELEIITYRGRDLTEEVHQGNLPKVGLDTENVPQTEEALPVESERVGGDYNISEKNGEEIGVFGANEDTSKLVTKGGDEADGRIDGTAEPQISEVSFPEERIDAEVRKEGDNMTDFTCSEEVASDITNVKDDAVDDLPSADVSVPEDKILDDEMPKTRDDDVDIIDFGDHKEEEVQDDVIGNDGLSKDRGLTTKETATEETGLPAPDAISNGDFASHPEEDLAEGGKNEGCEEQWQHPEASKVNESAKESEAATTDITGEISDQVAIGKDKDPSDSNVNRETIDGNTDKSYNTEAAEEVTRPEEVATDAANVKDDSVDDLPSAVSASEDKILDNDMPKTRDDDADAIGFLDDHKEEVHPNEIEPSLRTLEDEKIVEERHGDVIRNEAAKESEAATTDMTGEITDQVAIEQYNAPSDSNVYTETTDGDLEEVEKSNLTSESYTEAARDVNEAEDERASITEEGDNNTGECDPVPELTRDEFQSDITKEEAASSVIASEKYDIVGEEHARTGLTHSEDQTRKEYEEFSSRAISGEVVQEKASEVSTEQADAVPGGYNDAEAYSVKDDDTGTRKEVIGESTDREAKTDDGSDPIETEVPAVADSSEDFVHQETREIHPEQESLTETSVRSSGRVDLGENVAQEGNDNLTEDNEGGRLNPENTSEKALSTTEDQPLDVPDVSSEAKFESEETDSSEDVHLHPGVSALTDAENEVSETQTENVPKVLAEEKLDVDQRSAEFDTEILSAVPVDGNIGDQSVSNEASNYEETSAAETVVTESKIPKETATEELLRQDADEIDEDKAPTVAEGESVRELDEVPNREEVLEDINVSAGNVPHDTFEQLESEVNTEQPHDRAVQGDITVTEVPSEMIEKDGVDTTIPLIDRKASRGDGQLVSSEDLKYEVSAAAEAVTESEIPDEKILTRSFDGNTEAQIGQDADEAEYGATVPGEGNSAREHDEIPAREEVLSDLDVTTGETSAEEMMVHDDGAPQQIIADRTDIALTEATVESTEKAVVEDSCIGASTGTAATYERAEKLETDQKQDEPTNDDDASTRQDDIKIDAQTEETSDVTLSKTTEEVASKIHEDDSFRVASTDLGAGEVSEYNIEDSGISPEEAIKSEEILEKRQFVEEPALSQGDTGSSLVNERETVGSTEFTNATDSVQEVKEDIVQTEDVPNIESGVANEPLTGTGIEEDKDLTDIVEKNLIDGTETEEKIDTGEVVSETKDIDLREVEQYGQRVGESASGSQVGFLETPENEPSFARERGTEVIASDRTVVEDQTEEEIEEIYDSNDRTSKAIEYHQSSVNETSVEQSEGEKATNDVDSDITSGAETGIIDPETTRISRNVGAESFEEMKLAAENTEDKEPFGEEGKYNIKSKDPAEEVTESEEIVEVKETSEEAPLPHSELVESVVAEEENEVEDQEELSGVVTDSFSKKQDKEEKEPYEEISHPEQRGHASEVETTQILAAADEVTVTEADYDKGAVSAIAAATQELSTLEGDNQKDEARIEDKVEASENEAVRGLPTEDDPLESTQVLSKEEVSQEEENTSRDVETDRVIQEDETANKDEINEDNKQKDIDEANTRSFAINEETLATAAPATETVDLEVIEGERRDLNVSNEIVEEADSYTVGADTQLSGGSISDTQPGTSSENLDSENVEELHSAAVSVEDGADKEEGTDAGIEGTSKELVDSKGPDVEAIGQRGLLEAMEVSNEADLSVAPNETAAALQTLPTDDSYEQDSIELTTESKFQVESTPAASLAIGENVEIDLPHQSGELSTSEEAFFQMDRVNNSLPPEVESGGNESNEVLQNEAEVEETLQVACSTEISSDGPSDQLPAFSTRVQDDVQTKEILTEEDTSKIKEVVSEDMGESIDDAIREAIPATSDSQPIISEENLDSEKDGEVISAAVLADDGAGKKEGTDAGIEETSEELVDSKGPDVEAIGQRGFIDAMEVSNEAAAALQTLPTDDSYEQDSVELTTESKFQVQSAPAASSAIGENVEIDLPHQSGELSTSDEAFFQTDRVNNSLPPEVELGGNESNEVLQNEAESKEGGLVEEALQVPRSTETSSDGPSDQLPAFSTSVPDDVHEIETREIATLEDDQTSRTVQKELGNDGEDKAEFEDYAENEKKEIDVVHTQEYMLNEERPASGESVEETIASDQLTQSIKQESNDGQSGENIDLTKEVIKDVYTDVDGVAATSTGNLEGLIDSKGQEEEATGQRGLVIATEVLEEAALLDTPNETATTFQTHPTDDSYERDSIELAKENKVHVESAPTDGSAIGEIEQEVQDKTSDEQTSQLKIDNADLGADTPTRDVPAIAENVKINLAESDDRTTRSIDIGEQEHIQSRELSTSEEAFFQTDRVDDSLPPEVELEGNESNEVPQNEAESKEGGLVEEVLQVARSTEVSSDGPSDQVPAFSTNVANDVQEREISEIAAFEDDQTSRTLQKELGDGSANKAEFEDYAENEEKEIDEVHTQEYKSNEERPASGESVEETIASDQLTQSVEQESNDGQSGENIDLTKEVIKDVYTDVDGVAAASTGNLEALVDSKGQEEEATGQRGLVIATEVSEEAALSDTPNETATTFQTHPIDDLYEQDSMENKVHVESAPMDGSAIGDIEQEVQDKTSDEQTSQLKIDNTDLGADTPTRDVPAIAENVKINLVESDERTTRSIDIGEQEHIQSRELSTSEEAFFQTDRVDDSLPPEVELEGNKSNEVLQNEAESKEGGLVEEVLQVTRSTEVSLDGPSDQVPAFSTNVANDVQERQIREITALEDDQTSRTVQKELNDDSENKAEFKDYAENEEKEIDVVHTQDYTSNEERPASGELVEETIASDHLTQSVKQESNGGQSGENIDLTKEVIKDVYADIDGVAAVSTGNLEALVDSKGQEEEATGQRELVISTEVSEEAALSDNPNETATTFQTHPTDDSYERDSIELMKENKVHVESAPMDSSAIGEIEQEVQDKTSDEQTSQLKIDNADLGADTPTRDAPAIAENVKINLAESDERTTRSIDIGEQEHIQSRELSTSEEDFFQKDRVHDSLPTEVELEGNESNEVLQNEAESKEGGLVEEALLVARSTEVSLDGPSNQVPVFSTSVANDAHEREIHEIVALEDDQTGRTIQKELDDESRNEVEFEDNAENKEKEISIVHTQEYASNEERTASGESVEETIASDQFTRSVEQESNNGQSGENISEVIKDEYADVDGVTAVDAELGIVKTTRSAGNLGNESIGETSATVMPDETDNSKVESFISENQITTRQVEAIPGAEAVLTETEDVESASVGESTLDQNPSAKISQEESPLIQVSERESENQNVLSRATNEEWFDGNEPTLQTDLRQEELDTCIPKYAEKEKDVQENEEITPQEIGDRDFASAVQTKEVLTEEETSKIKEVVSEDAGESIDNAIGEAIPVTLDSQPSMSGENLVGEKDGEVISASVSADDGAGKEEGTDARIEETSEALIDSEGRVTEVSEDAALPDIPNETAATIQTLPTDGSYERDSVELTKESKDHAESAPADGSAIEFYKENEREVPDKKPDEQASQFEINNPDLAADTTRRDVLRTAENVEIDRAELDEQTTRSVDIDKQERQDEAFFQPDRIDSSLPPEAETGRNESNEVLQNEAETKEVLGEEALQFAPSAEISSHGADDVQEIETHEIIASEDDQTSRTIQKELDDESGNKVVQEFASNEERPASGESVEETISSDQLTQSIEHEVIEDVYTDVDGVAAGDAEAGIVETPQSTKSAGNLEDESIGEASTIVMPDVNDVSKEERFVEPIPREEAVQAETEDVEPASVGESSSLDQNPLAENEGVQSRAMTEAWSDVNEPTLQADVSQDESDTGMPKFVDKARDEQETPLELGDRDFAPAVQIREILTEEDGSKIEKVKSVNAGVTADEVHVLDIMALPADSSGREVQDKKSDEREVQDKKSDEQASQIEINNPDLAADMTRRDVPSTAENVEIDRAELDEQTTRSIDIDEQKRPDEAFIQTDRIDSSLPPEAETGRNESNEVLQNEAETKGEVLGQDVLQFAPTTEISSHGPDDVQEIETREIIASEDDQTSRTVQKELDVESGNKVKREFTSNEERPVSGESVKETISSEQEVFKDVYANVDGVAAADAEAGVVKTTQPTQSAGNLEDESIGEMSATVMPNENDDSKEESFREEAVLAETKDVEPASVGESSTLDQNPLVENEGVQPHAMTEAWSDVNEPTLQADVSQDESDTGMPKFADKERDVQETPLELGDRDFAPAVQTREILTEEDGSKIKEVESVNADVAANEEVQEDTGHAAVKPEDTIEVYQDDKTSAAASVVEAETTIPRGNEEAAAAEVGESSPEEGRQVAESESNIHDGNADESIDDTIGETIPMISDSSSAVPKKEEMLAADLKDVDIKEMDVDIPSTVRQAVTGTASDLSKGSIDDIASASATDETIAKTIDDVSNTNEKVDQESASLALPSEETVADKNTGTGDDNAEKYGESRSLDFTSAQADQEIRNEVSGGETLSDGYVVDKAEYGLASEAVEVADKVDPPVKEKEDKAFNEAQTLHEKASEEQVEFKLGATDEDKGPILPDANDTVEGTVDRAPLEEEEGQTVDGVESLHTDLKTEEAPAPDVQCPREKLFEGDGTRASEESKGLNQVTVSTEEAPTAYHDVGLPRDASLAKEFTAELPGSTERGLPPTEFEGEKFSASTTAVPLAGLLQKPAADNLQLPEQAAIIKPDEHEEHEDDDHERIEHSDAIPLIEESSKDFVDAKGRHKKSHNHLLSGMSSKVKSSISKVKKVITGKSSSHKENSPKHGH